MKLTIIFKPVFDLQDKSSETPLAFVEVQDEDGNTINDLHPWTFALDWIADGDHEALVIDTEKLPKKSASEDQITEILNGERDYQFYPRNGETLASVEREAREGLNNGPGGNEMILRLLEVVKALSK